MLKDARHLCKGIKRDAGETLALMQRKMKLMIVGLCLLYQEANQSKEHHQLRSKGVDQKVKESRVQTDQIGQKN